MRACALYDRLLHAIRGKDGSLLDVDGCGRERSFKLANVSKRRSVLSGMFPAQSVFGACLAGSFCGSLFRRLVIAPARSPTLLGADS